MRKNNIFIWTLAISTLLLNSCGYNPSNNIPNVIPNNVASWAVVDSKIDASPLDTSYIIDGENITLINGESEKEVAPWSASKEIIKIFSYDTKADVDNDWKQDTIVLLTKDSGWSGIFYYVAVAKGSDAWFKGSKTVLIWDRISPQNIEFRDGKIVVNYLKRKPWESFSEMNSEWASKYLTYTSGALEEVRSEVLSGEDAKELVLESIGDCARNECTNMVVNTLDGKDSIWYVETILDWVQDDSINSIKRIYRAHYKNNKWELWEEVLKEFKCQEWRWHVEFSDELCK